MTETPSNIRVFVHWKEPTVFAGENVECKITFKNIAPVPGGPNAARQAAKPNGFAVPGERQRKTAPPPPPPQNARPLPAQNSRSAFPPPRGHRPALSLNLPSATSSRSPGPDTPTSRQSSATTPGQKHVRSISIRSLGGSEAGADEKSASSQNGSVAGRRSSRSHTRSASLQVIPKRGGGINGSAYHSGQRSATQPSPLFNNIPSPLISDSQSGTGYPFPPRPSRRVSGVTTVPNTPGIPQSQRHPSTSFSQPFRFPPAPAGSRSPYLGSQTPPDSVISTTPPSLVPKDQPPRSVGERGAPSDHLAPATKILSASSLNGGTPRSSGEFYSISNNSSETLASEYNNQATNRLLQRPQHTRRPSQLSQISNADLPETIMMGYAQINGSFTLDGSLVNQAPFEDVKRRGVVGGQGSGGVVGVESRKRDSGLFGAFGWSNIGESIGGLLGGGELSSIKEMRGVASSKTIPLLSTPQSILFVDLNLGPGESKSYSYKFPLPTGLPPSHRGKAIKISYSLVIGTQRPSSKRGQQQVRHVDIPFRVFSGLNGRGQILGHDLMSPHILLKDNATTASLPNDDSLSVTFPAQNGASKPSGKSNSSKEDFLSYVESLVERPRQNSGVGLLSPTETRQHRHSSFFEEPSTVKEAIDLAILRSSSTSTPERSANRFDIARNGRRVAVLLLPRPAFRLGETITAIIDFSQSHIPCYAIHATLETSETVDPALSLRSDASIYRVTRKLYATRSESTLFAQRVIFSPTIPTNATPDFITSGVSLEWRLRVEFVTPRITLQSEDDTYGSALLEEVSRNERGIVLTAVEGLKCESFEVTVPLRVFGTPSGGVSKDELHSPVGLVV
ncbi:MAG: hypothetical protein M4579_004989 [Chaenotheca gracillima]|nr:MAG: hypothetical protein M4579_004989 [Chaenotheca gracillima]